VASRGTKVRVAQASENSKDGVVRHLAMKKIVWDTVIYGR